MNKCILLTGATGLLGRQMLNALLQKGYNVVFTVRKYEQGKEIQKEALHPERVFPVEVDLTSPNMAQIITENLTKHNIKINSLINNARYLAPPDKILSLRALWMNEYLLDVVVPQELTLALRKHSEQELKNIVNISSMYGVTAVNKNLYLDSEAPSPTRYSTAKAALIHLSKEMAVQYAPEIRVNTLSFGGVQGRSTEDFEKRYAKLCPQEKMLDMSDVIPPLLFLVSSASKGMTGHNLIVDGGWTIW